MVPVTSYDDDVELNSYTSLPYEGREVKYDWDSASSSYDRNRDHIPPWLNLTLFTHVGDPLIPVM